MISLIIFLDIDGVMTNANTWCKPEQLDDGFYNFSDSSVNLLNSIIDNQVKIILTTSHKSKFTINEWKKIFINRGVHISDLDVLEENINNLSRKDEIIKWFVDYCGDKIHGNFIIIDDDKTLNGLPFVLKERLYLTNSTGLLESDLDPLKKLINSYDNI